MENHDVNQDRRQLNEPTHATLQARAEPAAEAGARARFGVGAGLGSAG